MSKQPFRLLSEHIVEGDPAPQVAIEVLDAPGQGGGHHRYRISWCSLLGIETSTVIQFQDGPLKEVGPNGLPGEALLAIEIDRLRCFQDGPFACDENKMALEHCKLALSYLQVRTHKRIERGVEGKNEK